MKLYYAPGTCALACWIALEWAGADYEAVRADYKSEEYQRINPLGAVPALDIGGKRAMTQAPAILQYIADTHPESRLGTKGWKTRSSLTKPCPSSAAISTPPSGHFSCPTATPPTRAKPHAMP